MRKAHRNEATEYRKEMLGRLLTDGYVKDGCYSFHVDFCKRGFWVHKGSFRISFEDILVVGLNYMLPFLIILLIS